MGVGNNSNEGTHTMSTTLLRVGQMASFGGKTGEITAINRTRYAALGTDGRSYTVPFAMAKPLDNYVGPKPSASLPTFIVGQRVVTYAPNSRRFADIHGEVISVTRTTVKMMPDNDCWPISGPPSGFRAEA